MRAGLCTIIGFRTFPEDTALCDSRVGHSVTVGLGTFPCDSALYGSRTGHYVTVGFGSFHYFPVGSTRFSRKLHQYYTEDTAICNILQELFCLNSILAVGQEVSLPLHEVIPTNTCTLIVLWKVALGNGIMTAEAVDGRAATAISKVETTEWVRGALNMQTQHYCKVMHTLHATARYSA
jgi:hypothetical protein